MKKEQTGKKSRKVLLIVLCCVLAATLGLGIAALLGAFKKPDKNNPSEQESTAPATVAPTEPGNPSEPTEEPTKEPSQEPSKDPGDGKSGENPDFTPGDWDNNTALAGLTTFEQGSDGWWFLEGTSPDDVRILEKMNGDGTAYLSDTSEGLELKLDFVHPGADLDAMYRWIAGEDQEGLRIEGSYVKFGHQDSNPDWPDGVTLRIWHNDKLLLEKKVNVYAGDGNNNEITFAFSDLSVKAGDAFTFQISADGNNAWDGGRLSVRIGDGTTPQPDIDEIEPEAGRTNSTGIPEKFSGKQGHDGWYYGYCEWDSKGFTMLPYEAENERYYNNGKPELKKDFVEPGSGKNAAYKWIVAQDGAISVKGDYVKFANNSDPAADGTCVRIFLNGVEKKWMGNNTMGNFADERSESFDEVYTVKAGDVLIFAVNPEGNDSWDGGRLTITIRPASNPPAPGTEPEPEAGRENRTGLAEDFSGTQGKSGWYYGSSDWDSKNFAMLPYEAQNERYFNNGKPELKKDFVEPGNGRNAAYKWIVAKNGKIRVQGEYVKFANNEDSNADGTCARIFLNGDEKKWISAQGNFASERVTPFDEIFDVKAGDELMFTVDPEGNDSWDGGRLTVRISPADDSSSVVDKAALGSAIDAAKALNKNNYTEASWKAVEEALQNAENVNQNPDATQAEVDAAKDALNAAVAALEKVPVEPDPERTNNTVLFDDFTGTQGENGWYYGSSKWNGTEFVELPYDEENSRYYNNGKPELKRDFVEPGNGRNAAYKWVAARDGKIQVRGEYVKFANNEDPAADGTCARIYLNTVEKKWMDLRGNSAEERSVSFDETLEVKAGDELIFNVDPEGNDAYDGGRFSITISAIQEGGDEPEPEVDKSALKEAIDAAKALNEDDYTAESWSAMTSALSAAESIYEKEDATQEEVDAAKAALNDAVAALEKKPVEPERTNNTVLLDDFTGVQGENGWHYGSSSWNGTEFVELPYDEENSRYYNNGKPELKKDFVEPGNGRSAAYKWVAAQDGKIRVKGEYVKFANSDDPDADGTCFRIRLNMEPEHWFSAQGNFSEEKVISFDIIYEVKAGDEVLFVISPEDNDAWDGGRLSVMIAPEGEPEPEVDKSALKEAIDAAKALNEDDYTEESWSAMTSALSAAENIYEKEDATQEEVDAAKAALNDAVAALEKKPVEPERTNNTVLLDDFTGTQGENGWHYGSSSWDGSEFAELPYDEENSRYFNNGKPELKKDFVEPGNGRSAAYKWVAAQDGKIRVKGEYVKFANSDDRTADGTCFRIRLNMEPEHWFSAQGNFSEEKVISFDIVYEVKAGDEVLFVISPEDNDAWDGGRLSVTISPESES